ncbi:MAG: hypothetical protein FWJ90_02345 [Actinomadura sp.]
MAAEFDETVFDDDFVRGAAFTEPSAEERIRRPDGREQRRIRRAARRALRAGAVRPPRRGRREPSHRRAVLQVIGAVVLLFAISFALWWYNSAPREPEPVQPIVPTVPGQPPPHPTQEAPGEAPGSPVAPEIPEI